MRREQKVLKAVLLLRGYGNPWWDGNRYKTKEKQLEEVSRFSDELLDAWIQSLLLDCRKTREEFEKESLETIKRLEEYELKETLEEMKYLKQEEEGRGYGPGNPWDAPGMSVRDFI